MNLGLLLPGFSADEADPAIPVQLDLVRALAQAETVLALAQAEPVRVLALRYPHRRGRYRVHGAEVTALGAGQATGAGRLRLWADALRTLARLHRETPFDVLHAMWADETGLLAAWGGRLLRVPVVVSLLGGELARLDDVGYGLQRGRFSRWTVGGALSGAARVLVAGPYALGAFRACGYALDERRVRVAPLGVDTARFHPTALPRLRGRLLHVGSLIPVKDQATLLRALARLDDGVTLDIAGDGPERGRLEALAGSLGVGGRVAFLGAVPHAELPAYYRRAALHVLASRSEALPIALLEAAASGLFTASTAAGALPDYPALAGTVPVGDDAALAGAIAGLLADDARRAALGAGARAAVEGMFTVEAAVARLRAMYADVAGEKGSPTRRDSGHPA